jgi:hypothetical protein
MPELNQVGEFCPNPVCPRTGKRSQSKRNRISSSFGEAAKGGNAIVARHVVKRSERQRAPSLSIARNPKPQFLSVLP